MFLRYQDICLNGNKAKGNIEMNELEIVNNKELTIDNREVAEITGKEHKHIMSIFVGMSRFYQPVQIWTR